MNSIYLLTLLCTIGCGVMAGFFFAFSICVMRALQRLPPEHGIAAMQSINVVVINRWFLSVFFGTAVLGIAAAIAAVSRSAGTTAWATVAGCLCYLLGTVGVTMLANVPRNRALATAAAGDVDGARLWQSFLPSWTAWNHVRTAAALAASVFFALALPLTR